VVLENVGGEREVVVPSVKSPLLRGWGGLVRGINMHRCGGNRYAEFVMVLARELGDG